MFVNNIYLYLFDCVKNTCIIKSCVLPYTQRTTHYCIYETGYDLFMLGQPLHVIPKVKQLSTQLQFKKIDHKMKIMWCSKQATQKWWALHWMKINTVYFMLLRPNYSVKEGTSDAQYSLKVSWAKQSCVVGNSKNAGLNDKKWVL